MTVRPPTSARHGASPRRRVVAGTIVLVVLATIGVRFSHDVALGSDSAQRRNETVLASIGTLVPDDTLDSRILGLELTGERWTDEIKALDAALFTYEDALRRHEQARAVLATTRASRRAVSAELRYAEELAETVDERVDSLEQLLSQRAVALFVNFGDAETDALSSARAAADGARVRQLADQVDESQFDKRDRLVTQQIDLDQVLSALRGRLIELTTTEAALKRSTVTALSDMGHSNAAVQSAINRVRDARRSARILGYDFSITALDAYFNAESLLAETRPDCHAKWWMIAAIARVESHHGELGGRSILDSGRTSSDIVGIVLDGGPGVRAVVDTDNGSLDGDQVWDRAVGPMQFIPETWTIRGRDASSDGIADPHNLYDAAFTTGRYLCQLGGDLSVDANLRDAYYGYNSSSAYVDNVERYALFYAKLVLDAS